MTYALVSINNATVGGVYYCADFTTSGAIVWTKLTTTGLYDLNISHFRVDYGDPLDRQFVRCSDECIYARNGGDWTKVLDHATAAAAASESPTNSVLEWLYTDPTTPGSVYSLFMTNPDDPPPQSGIGYVMKSLDYGATWTAHAFSSGRSRVKCVEVIGDHIWASAGKLIIAASSIYYSSDGGGIFSGQLATAGSSGTANLRINPHSPNKVFSWGDGNSNEWTYSGGVFSSRSISTAFESAGGDPDNAWFDPDVPGRVIKHSTLGGLYYTDDYFVTKGTTVVDDYYPKGIIGAYNASGESGLLYGLHTLSERTLSYLSSQTDTTGTERGGANTGTPPYTDSIPNVLELSEYGIWWGTPLTETRGVYVYADEQGDIADVPTKNGLGLPMFGDRSSWRDYDADDDGLIVPTELSKYHAEDIFDDTPQRHAPWDAASPPPAGYGIISDGSKWEVSSDEIALEGDLHDAVTLDADAALILDLTTQEIGLDVQSANTVLAGPTSGAANEPTFRALVVDDLPPDMHDHIINENHTDECDGLEVTFSTFFTFRKDSTAVYLNGIRQLLGIDYTEAATYDSITFTTAPEDDDVLVIDYICERADALDWEDLLIDSGSIPLLDDDDEFIMDS